jgi:hypothetical protein
MDDDFPSAHSMDTLWFAVDDAGHVGVFDTGEEGHVPEGANDAGNLIADLMERRYPQEELSWEAEELAEKLGVYYFDYDGDYATEPIAPYRRSAAPASPLHVDQLPPAVRRQAGRLLLRDVDFARCDLVQPLEQVSCIFWSDEELAYLCGDGKTVRPIPGKEDRFAEFCKQFRQANPEEASKLVFEVPEEKPSNPLTRRRKENDDGK